jgi:hypothetical protein
MTKLNIEVINDDAENDARQVQEKGSQLSVQLDETEPEKKDTNVTEEKTRVETNKNRLFCYYPKSFRAYKNIKRYLNSIFIRLMFLALPCFHIYLVSCLYSNSLFYILFVYIIVILLDGIYVLVKRQGNEHHW